MDDLEKAKKDICELLKLMDKNARDFIKMVVRKFCNNQEWVEKLGNNYGWVLCVLAFVGIAVLYQCLFHRHFWDMITALATVLIVLVAYIQLSEANKTSKASFIRQFSNGFFSENTRDIMLLLEMSALIYEEENNLSFKIKVEDLDNMGISKVKKEELTRRERYSAYEIDDWLLGPIEEIASFEKNGLISLPEVYDQFDWYVDVACKSPAILDYIEDSRKGGHTDIYEDFERIAFELKNYGDNLDK